ncbi:MAG: hypothetical protein A2231_11275 [Candidatus Firestonebacteria bacterium RIFOXYA2_FULL_40_8]|nr:MAG: hypothetical protein A2231_11275 [Candidatus Firestonebacteria bacterium RIFOXYA2_FULL_40_8]
MTENFSNEEMKEVKSKAYALYKKHGFKDGNDYVDWLEAERQEGAEIKLKLRKHMQKILFSIVGILGVIVVILFVLLFRDNSRIELSEKSLAELKVTMLLIGQKADEKIVTFGDTRFSYNKSTLTGEAKMLLDREVVVLKENPKIKVRMAGYTSAEGTEESNQKLSEIRAEVVRNYLIEKGIKPERITTIGYGRTKPALFEANPGNINTSEAKANMRVLFEVVVK